MLRTDGTTAPAVAFAIGRPVGTAVVRNRLRRRLRELVRAHSDQLEPGCSYLIGAGVGAVSMSWSELDRALGEALRRTAVVS